MARTLYRECEASLVRRSGTPRSLFRLRSLRGFRRQLRRRLREPGRRRRGGAAGSADRAPAEGVCPLAGGPPIFLGVADTGRRPDVAALYGAQFADAGSGLIVDGLTPGNYDLAVFAGSAITGDFLPATVVRVTVR